MARKKDGRGWHGEPRRHAQAARGQKTAKNPGRPVRVTVGPVERAETMLRLGWNDQLPGSARYPVLWSKKPVIQRRSLHFTTEGLSQRQAGDALLLAINQNKPNHVHQYENFNPFAVGETLRNMRLDLGNVYIGREGSPVMYFEGASPEAVNAFLKNLKKRDRHALPDEFGGPRNVPMMKRNTEVVGMSQPAAPLGKTPFNWRLWWD